MGRAVSLVGTMLDYQRLYAQVTGLRAKNPDLKVLLAVGGWAAGYEPFYDVMGSAENITEFANNVVAYLRSQNMDGLDMDWEFPGSRGSPPEDRENFTYLMKELYTAFKEESVRTKKPKLLLTLATAVGWDYIVDAYEPRQIYHTLYVLLRTYFSVDVTAKRLATYGMSFTLEDPSQHGVYAPALGGGEPGKYSRQEGILAYYEICDYIQNQGWTREWIGHQFVPYAYKGDQWVGYDDTISLGYKVREMINNLGLAGAFIWAIDLDDFSGHCGQGKYPLLHAINNAL
ncbi:acidic mammalian chitinase [Aplysia californica]|uniref:Acidic mammalian chitinase n=1 Tax=Aplysia californica TaxID=6500 RepID=A0ABM1W1L2_APLCA|nr:acidic mammalian chitinase [Aplysia californica]